MAWTRNDEIERIAAGRTDAVMQDVTPPPAPRGDLMRNAATDGPLVSASRTGAAPAPAAAPSASGAAPSTTTGTIPGTWHPADATDNAQAAGEVLDRMLPTSGRAIPLRPAPQVGASQITPPTQQQLPPAPSLKANPGESVFTSMLNLGGDMAKYRDAATVNKQAQRGFENEVKAGTLDEARAARVDTAGYRDRALDESERHARATETIQAAGVVVGARNKPPAGYAWGPRDASGQPSLVAIAGGPAALGKALPGKAVEDLAAAGGAVESAERLRSTFQAGYGNKTILGDLSNTYKRVMGDDTGQAQWWQDMDALQNQTRHALFGSALTKTELAAWEKTSITPRMDESQIRENLNRRAAIEARAASKLARAYEAGGHNKQQIQELLGGAAEYLNQAAPAVNSQNPGRGTPGAGESRQLGGKTYVKVNGQWYEQ